MDTALEVLQSPIDVGFRLNVKEKSVAGTTCGFVVGDKLYRTRVVTFTYAGGSTKVITTSLSNPDAVAVVRDSGDVCDYSVETTGTEGDILIGEDTTFEDEITIPDLQAWADGILATMDWNDISAPAALPLGGTKGWNNLFPFDYTGGSNPNDILYTSANEIDTASVLVTQSQIGWAVTKSHVPYLISWDEVLFSGGVETSRTPQTQQMGSGVWDTGFTDWTPGSNVDKQIQNARFNLPWFPP